MDPTFQVNIREYILMNFTIKYSCFHLYGNLPYTYPSPFSPSLLLPFRIPCHFLPLPSELPSILTAKVTPPPHENVTAAILSYAVSHLHEGTGKLRKTCADTVGHLTEPVRSLTVSVKWPPAQCFDVQAADRRSPIQVLTQRKAVSFGWSPGIRHLPNTEHCRFNWLTED